MHFRRPSLSPTKKVRIHPENAPSKTVSGISYEYYAGQTYQIVDTDDNTFQSTAGVAEGVLPVIVVDNAREYTLIIPKKDEGQLASEGDS